MQKLKLAEQELLNFVMRCLQWSNADVFAMGRRDSISRLGEIAAYIGNLNGKEDRPAANSVRIILPPAAGRQSDAMLTDVKEGVRRAFRRFEPDDAKTASFVEAMYARIRIDHAADYTMKSLQPLLEATSEREAVIVGEAAHYRSDTIKLPDNGPRLPEDVWSVHLHATMLLSEEKAKESGGYILLDIAQFFPAREANMELLRSAGDVGLCGGSEDQSISPEEMIVLVGAAFDAAAAGDLGRAVSMVEDDGRLSELQKWMLRLTLLQRGGARDEVSRTLDESGTIIAKLKNEDLLGLARIATGIDRDDYAQDLIERALPTLTTAHDLEAALDTARDTRRRPIIQKVRDRLRALHPGSQLLRSVDGREAALEGDYARAAELLKGSPDEREQEVGRVFGLLAPAVAGEGFARPAELARELVAELPGWKSDLQRELIRSLERSGRRDDAVAMLLQDDIDWDETWFVFARGVLDRSLASGSGAVSPAVLTRMINVAASYIAAHPEAGFARTSFSDLLGAEHVGLGGTFILAVNVASRASHQPDAETDREKEPKQLKDIRTLVPILHRVLEWLQAQGSGIITPGRETVPAEVLREDPDAVLHGILKSVDYHVPAPDDPVEEVVLRNFGNTAIAIAPSAEDRDGDIVVLRGTAIKAKISGRPQLARDLAEQILLVAGDRPERRRRALTAFADIYARAGRLREALLVLAAAFELPSSRTWREMWEEQSVLLRILRDARMPELALKIIERLRAVCAKVDGAPAYSSRLDTLELHAQLRLSETDADGAWTTERLLASTIANTRSVLDVGDETLPSAIMLRQLIDRAELEGREVPPDAQEMLDRLYDGLAPPFRALVDAAGRQADAASIAAIAGSIGPARYNDDVSYDLKLVRSMATRLARSSVERVDPAGFAYAVELQGVQGLGVHGDGPEVKPAARLLAELGDPLAAALEIAKLGIPIVGLALDERGLMTMMVDEHGATEPVAVDTATFDPARLHEWSRSFPYGYADEELDEYGFRASTAGIGLPELPGRTIVLSGGLAPVPPNVMTIGWNLAGLTHTIATAPSLSWLKASLTSNRLGNRGAAAWIPIASGGSATDTLSLMVDEVRDVLDRASIALHTQSSPPDALATADLAIIGAHGGLANGNRFFRGLSDDRHQPADLRQLVDVLTTSRVALLFVCSGGRLDQNPESGGLVGIAQRLLDRGVDAVLAPSWPIPFMMVRPWLNGFLKAWEAGAPVIDAYAAANKAVSDATSCDLPRSLAMSLYGNPFVAR